MVSKKVYEILRAHVAPRVSFDVNKLFQKAMLVNPCAQIGYVLINGYRLSENSGASWLEIVSNLLWLVVVGIVWVKSLIDGHEAATMLFFWTWLLMVANFGLACILVCR